MKGFRPNGWLLVPLSILLGVVALAWQQSEVPERSEWAAATTAIRHELEPNDGVAWIPYWAGEGRLFLHGLPGFHLTEPANPDLARYRRVWLLGAFGHDASDLGGELRVLRRQDFGSVSLELIEVTGPRVVADLRAELDRVKVSRTTAQGRETACDFWDGRGWWCDLRKPPDAIRTCLGESTEVRFQQRQRDPTCGLPRWFDGPDRYGIGRGPQPVARDARVIAEAPRRCVWFNPPPDRATQRIEWPVAGVGMLVLDYGFTDHAITDHAWEVPRTRAARLVVKRGGQTIKEIEVLPIKGWHRIEVPIVGTAPVVLEVSGESDIDAHLCLDATVRGGR